VEVRTRKETNKYDTVLAVHAAGGVDARAVLASPGPTALAALQREAPHLKMRRAGRPWIDDLPENFGEGAERPSDGAGLDREATDGASDRLSSLP